MKLTVTAPCFNEIRFVEAWIQNCIDFGACQVIVSEGGSTDGTREALEMHQRMYGRDWLTILDHPQPADPMRYGFNEGERRQALADAVTEGMQLLLDVDEMFPDDLRRILSDIPPKTVGKLAWLNFWRSPNYIRVDAPGDANWGPSYRPCVFPAGAMRWTRARNHCEIICDLPMWPVNGAKMHYHYLYGEAKAFENRIAEFKGIDAVGSDDVRLKTIRMRHPKAFGMLQDNVRFEDMIA